MEIQTKTDAERDSAKREALRAQDAGDRHPLEVVEPRIPPVRGLAPLHNARGQMFSALDIKRWLRLNRIVYKADKVDLLLHGAQPAYIEEVLDYSAFLDMRASLRTDASTPPPTPETLRAQGWFDVFLNMGAAAATEFDAWLDACKQADLPIRVQIQAPFAGDFDADTFLDKLTAHGVVLLNVALYDPFHAPGSCLGSGQEAATVAIMAALAEGAESRGMESNILGVPFCQIPRESWLRTVNSPQFFADHSQYEQRAYDLAKRLYPRRKYVATKVLQIYLGRYTSFRNPIDEAIIRYLMYKRPALFARALGWHKISRHLSLWPWAARPATQEKALAAAEKKRRQQEKQWRKSTTSECVKCSMRLLCDRATPEFRTILPGLKVKAQDGDLYYSPLHWSTKQPKYYDAVDRDRRAFSEGHLALAHDALSLVNNTKPYHEVDSFDYFVEDAYSEQMPGGVRWFGVANTEKISSPLTCMQPPFTVAATFGGGIAEYIGFSFGRHCKLVCPMEAYAHKLVLHVATDGHYVLLRDGKPVRPVEFAGAHYAPLRLGGYLEPCISVWNIDHTLVTQTVQIWKGDAAGQDDLSRIKYTVLLVSTRYARRLQAVLQNIAHQTDVSLREIEVVIGYVPGLDATDDLIDSMSQVYPELRIVRSPFPKENTNSKGFLLNESARMAQGEWVLIIDSDILLPPRWMAALDAVPEDVHFAAPDGRKMLSPETTAKVLLGEVQPWTEWENLLETAGEFRLREAWGVPIGFCQCVRRSCLEKVKYNEYDHFEGADWQFGVDMRNQFGKEQRLSGLPVLHLDHGGSQWYGTQKHL